MSRFNTPTVASVPRKENTRNLASGEAFTQDAKMQLVSHLLTSFVQDQFYRTANEGIDDLKKLVRAVDPQFAAKAAIFARNEFGMRSVTHIVGGEIPAFVKGERWTKNFIEKLIYRPDDATEIMSYYLANYGKPVPNSLKKGIARGLAKFDAYQLAKYRGEDKGVKLVDLLNLVHLKPTAHNRDALEKLIDGELRQTKTWEAALSEAGKTGEPEAKGLAWAKSIPNMGYLAALRNIRNVERDAPELLDDLLAILTDAEKVARSKVFPFQFLTAYDAVVQDVRSTRNFTKIASALDDSLELVFQNVPVFDGETLVVYDSSSSMTTAPYLRDAKGRPIYSKKARPIAEYAAVFVAALTKKNAADVMQFDGRARYVRLNPRDSFATLRDQVLRSCRGGATDAGQIFKAANRAYDRIVILSDHQSWSHGERYHYGYRYGGAWDYSTPEQERAVYQRKFKVRPWIYSFDLAGYGTLSFPEADSKVVELAGYSDKVFDTMKLLEQDKTALIKRIESIQL